jgi:hypothetical protein
VIEGSGMMKVIRAEHQRPVYFGFLYKQRVKTNKTLDYDDDCGILCKISMRLLLTLSVRITGVEVYAVAEA